MYRYDRFLCRLFWILSVSAGFGLFATVMTARLLQYFSYPKRVNVQLTYTKEMKFPAVTICNQNLFRYKLLNECRPWLQAIGCIHSTCSCIVRADFKYHVHLTADEWHNSETMFFNTIQNVVRMKQFQCWTINQSQTKLQIFRPHLFYLSHNRRLYMYHNRYVYLVE